MMDEPVITRKGQPACLGQASQSLHCLGQASQSLHCLGRAFQPFY